MRIVTAPRTGSILMALAFAAASALPAAAQDPTTWQSSSELSYVSTGGNASSSTLGLKAALTGTQGVHTFKLEAGGIRSRTGLITRTATGTETSYTVSKTTVMRMTAENYFLRGRYDRAFDNSFAFAGAGWDRNTFAGIQNRYVLVAGLGRTLMDGESGHLKADVGATYTVQKDVDPTPGAKEGFGGLRMNVDALRHLSASADFASSLVLDESLQDTQDVRADWTNSITMTLSEKLAFKTSLQLLYDHVPALIGVPLVDGSGADTGVTVSTPGDTLDRIMTLTLVIKL